MTIKNTTLVFFITITVFIILWIITPIISSDNGLTQKQSLQKQANGTDATPIKNKEFSKKSKTKASVVTAKAEMVNTPLIIDTIGTLRANESIIVSAKVTESISQIHFDSGEQVAQDQLLLTLNSQDAQADLALAKVKVRESERELLRIDALVNDKVVAKLEQDRLQSLLDSAKAQEQQALAFMAKHEIHAPFAGTLGLRQVSLGSLVTPNTKITTLDDLSAMKLDFDLPALVLPSLALGQSLTATIKASKNKSYLGKIIAIDSQIDPLTRSIKVRALLPNINKQLKPGMLASIQLSLANKSTMQVPEAALIPIGEQKFVYLVNEQGLVEKRLVTIGSRAQGKVEILSGLSPTERIVVRGAFKVAPNKAVIELTEEQFTQKELAELSL